MEEEQEEIEEENQEQEIDEEDIGIRFDFDRLEHRGEVQTSLTDLYGFPVFSEVFAAQINQFHEQQRQEREQAFRNVFFGDPTEDLMEIFVQVMQAEPEMIILADHQTEVTTDSALQMVGFGVLGMIFAGFLVMLIQIIKSKRRSV